MNLGVAIVNFHIPGIYTPMSTKYVRMESLVNAGFVFPPDVKRVNIKDGIVKLFKTHTEAKTDMYPNLSFVISFSCSPVEELEFPFQCDMIINVFRDAYDSPC